MIKRIVKLTFQAEQATSFLQLFDRTKTQIRHFPGCHHLELLRVKDQPAQFFTYSYWQDEAALEAYRHSDLFAGTWRTVKPWFAAPAEAWSTTQCEGGSDPDCVSVS